MREASEEPAFDPGSLFERVLAGADGSEPGLEATRQAARLLAPGGLLQILTAVDLAEATRTGFSAPRVAERLEREAEEANRQALELAGEGAEGRVVNGPAFPTILREIEESRIELVVVGSHGHRRLSEIVLGGVAGELLYRVPCSVLLTRPPAEPERFPRLIAAGDDGSAHAAQAVAVAEELARRFGSEARAVRAEREPVRELVEASRDADLVAVGSRGLRGLSALGSVSERVAHEAGCSVLVVRPRGA